MLLALLSLLTAHCLLLDACCWLLAVRSSMLGAACGWPLLAVVGLCLLLARLLLFPGVFVAAAFLTSQNKATYSYCE